MENFLILKEHASRLFGSASRLKLYFRFNSETRNFDAKMLKLEIENIKQIISDVEKAMEKL